MATQPGTGVNATSSLLSFAMPAILGSTDHLHEWAHNRLAITLASSGEAVDKGTLVNGVDRAAASGSHQPQPSTIGIEPTMLAQVTAAVMVAFRTGSGLKVGKQGARSAGKATDDAKPYSEFQLAKLKGFCCVQNNLSLPPIWEYF